MKRVLISILIIFALAIGGVFYFKLFEGEVIVPEIEKEDETTIIINKLQSLPSCTTNLQDVEAIKVDDVVTNCTQKNATSPLWGFWGAYDIIFFHTTTLALLIDEDVSTMIQAGDIPIEDVLCFDNNQNNYAIKFLSNPYWTNQEQYNLYNKAKWLLSKLSNIDALYHPDWRYCENSGEDCGAMGESSRQIDDNNYVVYGRRTNDDMYYAVINGKLYALWKLYWTDDHSRHISDIKDWKVIVRKIENMQENEEQYKVTFTLKTCEIEL